MHDTSADGHVRARESAENVTVTSNTSETEGADPASVDTLLTRIVGFTGELDQELKKLTAQQLIDMTRTKPEIMPPEWAQDLARKPTPETQLTAFLPLLSQLQQQSLNPYAPPNPFYNQLPKQQIQGQQPQYLDNKYGALWWNEDITIPAKRGQISLRLKKFLDLIGIKGKQVYSFRHSVATQLLVMGLDETLLNTHSGHARNSKSTNDYYVFAERLKDNEIAPKLSDTRGQVKCNPIL
ncbi:MAG: hypothetical protein EZS28_049193, partial [Streblomastix strix]